MIKHNNDFSAVEEYLSRHPIFDKIRNNYTCLDSINVTIYENRLDFDMVIETVIKTKTNNAIAYKISLNQNLFFAFAGSPIDFIVRDVQMNYGKYEDIIIGGLDKEQKKYETLLLVNQLDKELPKKEEEPKRKLKI